MDTETIDKLYLELSQVTKAKTQRELDYEELLNVLAYCDLTASGMRNYVREFMKKRGLK